MNKFIKRLRRLILKPLDFIFNRKIKKYILGGHSTYVVGAKGAGKSSLFALVSETSLKQKNDVYCQYPYEGCYKIPMKEIDMGRYVVKSRTKLPNGKFFEDKVWDKNIVFSIDKKWLYSSDFKDCTILLDEARTIWPNRQYMNWTVSDDEFFNFLRKNNICLFFSSQNNDAIDLNCRRSTDEVWFLWKKNDTSPFTHIEVYNTMEVPIADLTKEISLSFLSKPLHPTNWEICSNLSRKFIFYRPPYYGLFDTNFYYADKSEVEAELWNA